MSDEIYTKNSPCPFVRSGECEIPPCNSCYLYNCKLNSEWEGDENE